MSEHSNEQDRFTELETLLVAVVLDDVTAEQHERLNDLLLSDIELRRYAARFLEEEAVLRHQIQVLCRVGDFHRPPFDPAESLNTVAAPGVDTQRRASPERRLRLSPYFAALSLLIIAPAASLLVWRGEGRLPIASRDASDTLQGLDREQGAIARREAAVLPRVTKVLWTGPQFASDIEPGRLTSILREGMIRFASANGLQAQGYIVKLPPGAVLDLMVATDAEGENALSVIELDRDGRPTGRRFSFSNSTADVTADPGLQRITPASTRFGPIGSWAERNNSPHSRYFLFTSVHKLVDKSTDDSWYVSRLSVMLDEPDLIHLGWDDGGLHLERDHEYIPDNDYDDLSATIRIHRGSTTAPEASPGVRVLGAAAPELISSHFSALEIGMPVDAEELLLLDHDKGFSFAVAAGESVVLKITNRVSDPVSIALLEKGTGRLRWICEHTRPRLANIGFCAIENNTRSSEQFVLVCRRKSQSGEQPGAERAAKHAVLFEQNAFVSVGFDIGPQHGGFENLKVDLLRMDGL